MNTPALHPVIVGVDGSPPSERALLWAAEAAARRSLPLTIVYASQFAGRANASGEVSPDVVTEAEQLLRDAEQRVLAAQAGVKTAIGVFPDSPARALVHASQAANMIVVGNRGHGGFHDLLVGSTSLHTAMHAKCTVAVIRPNQRSTALDVRSADRIVVGVDGSDKAAPALEFAFDEAQRVGRSVTAVYAWQAPITSGAVGVMMPTIVDIKAGTDAAAKVVADAITPWRNRYPQIDVQELALQMPAAAALAQESMGAYLVVVGSRGLGGFAGLVFGSTGHALIHHAGCPVVIAREAAAG